MQEELTDSRHGSIDLVSEPEPEYIHSVETVTYLSACYTHFHKVSISLKTIFNGLERYKNSILNKTVIHIGQQYHKNSNSLGANF